MSNRKKNISKIQKEILDKKDENFKEIFTFDGLISEEAQMKILMNEKKAERNSKLFAYFSMSVLDIWEHFDLEGPLDQMVFRDTEVTFSSYVRHLKNNGPINIFLANNPSVLKYSLEVLVNAFNPDGNSDNDMIGELQQKSIQKVPADNINEFIELQKSRKQEQCKGNPILDLDSTETLKVLDHLKLCGPYLIVGGIAVNHHGNIRATDGIDIWASRPQDFALAKVPDFVNIYFWLHNFHYRQFWGCYYRSEAIDIKGIEVKIMSFDDLIEEKNIRNSTLDQSDITQLLKVNKKE